MDRTFAEVEETGLASQTPTKVPRIRLINADPREGRQATDLLPEAACGCDAHFIDCTSYG